MDAPRLLVIDDDPLIGGSLKETFHQGGYQVDWASEAMAALALMQLNDYALALLDMNLGPSSLTGMELLRKLRQGYPNLPVVMITGYGSIDQAIETIKLGATDYLSKPLEDRVLRSMLARVLEKNKGMLPVIPGVPGGNLVGQDPKMLRILELVQAVAPGRTTVLISGESGTGKSMMARVIHQCSGRRQGPFMEVSCGSLPETLLESELFGHLQGSFAGASQDYPGRFVAADGGTLFLDEIHAASPSFQVKLLRVLQERRFEALGSTQTTSVDVRLVLATHQDLGRLVQEGKFRQDLYYRINVMHVAVPALRERLGDLPALCEVFIEKFNREYRKSIRGIHPQVLGIFQSYRWPGNVRELENVLERAVVLCRGHLLEVVDLPPHLAEFTTRPAPPNSLIWQPMSLRQAMEEPERQIIAAALRANNFNRQATAIQLEINRTTLYKKMKRYGLHEL